MDCNWWKTQFKLAKAKKGEFMVPITEKNVKLVSVTACYKELERMSSGPSIYICILIVIYMVHIFWKIWCTETDMIMIYVGVCVYAPFFIQPLSLLSQNDYTCSLPYDLLRSGLVERNRYLFIRRPRQDSFCIFLSLFGNLPIYGQDMECPDYG